MLSFLLKQWSKYIYNFKTSWLKNRKSNALENRKMDKENQEEETPMAENPKQWLPLPWGLDPQAEPGIGHCAGRCGSGLSCYGAVFVCPVVRMCPCHRRACVPRGSVALLLHIYLGSCCVLGQLVTAKWWWSWCAVVQVTGFSTWGQWESDTHSIETGLPVLNLDPPRLATCRGPTPLLGWQGRVTQLRSAGIPGHMPIPCSWYQIPFWPRIFSTSDGFVTVQHHPGQGAFVLGKPKHFTGVGKPDLHLLMWVGLWGFSSSWKQNSAEMRVKPHSDVLGV